MTCLPLRVSFHDPDGSVHFGSTSVLRKLKPAAASRLLSFMGTALCHDLLAEGLLPATRHMAEGESGRPPQPCDADPMVWFAHERLPFINYPHEWLPEQLHEAGQTTLQLAQRARAADWDLKDGNARNVVFHGMAPVFVDLGSFVPRSDDSPVWRPAGQLQRHVLLPLLMYRQRGLSPAALLLGRPDGISHAEAYAALRGSRFTNRDVFWLCAVPAWLAGRDGPTRSPRRYAPAVARATADMTIRSSMRQLNRVAGPSRSVASHWAAYEASRSHYSAGELEVKRSAVDAMLRRIGPGQLLDIGTNGGEYANLAASLGYQVVAIDSDIDALRMARQQARLAGLNMLHLLVNFAAPTPALGWSGAECMSFDQRCTNAFETVMVLAVIHHVLVSGGIPLAELVDKLASYTRRNLVIEYVDPTDQMFLRLTSQHALDFSSLTRSSFEATLALRFVVDERVELIAGKRTLYRCTRRAG